MSAFGLFLLFAKIGLFTFGGGYAMIPLFQYELVTRHQFISAEDFANMVALAQITPGPVGLNAATYIGYLQSVGNGLLPGVLGAAAGTLGVMTASLTVVLLAALFVQAFKDNRIIAGLLCGIRPATLGLIAAAVIFFADTSVFAAPLSTLWTRTGGKFGLCWQGTVIFLLVLAVQKYCRINMIWTLLGSAVLAWLLFLLPF